MRSSSTPAVYACLVRRDDRHGAAAEHLRNARGRRGFVTTDYVLDETITLLKVRGSGHLIQEFLSITLGSPACRVEWMDPQRFDAARYFLLRHVDHEYSFTDCFSFCTMKQFRIREALTKDEHFLQAGYRPLLV